jgi:hypothetical protein
VQILNRPKITVKVDGEKTIMLATPMYGGQCGGPFVESIIQFFGMCSEKKMKATYSFVYNESLVHRARNLLANVFMKSEATHLLFVDSDIKFDAGDAFRMIDSNELIVGGSYPKKGINWEGVAKACKAGAPIEHLQHCTGDHVVHLPPGEHTINVFQPYPTPYLGTGFMLIARECFERFQEKFPEQWAASHDQRNPGKMWIYFDCGIERQEGLRREYLSEDYWFCHRMQEIGITPKFIPCINLTHYGTYSFNGCKFCSEGNYIHDLQIPGQPREANVDQEDPTKCPK